MRRTNAVVLVVVLLLVGGLLAASLPRLQEAQARTGCHNNLKQIGITPHIAWTTREARRLLGATVANVASFLAGRPTNVVN